MIEMIFAIIMSFIGTNIDDIFLDMLFFSQARTKREVKSIVIGKYLGVGSLVLLGCLGAYVLHAMPEKYLGFLGLVPIALGIKEGIEYVKSKKQSDSEDKQPDLSKGLVWSVMLITMSGGADNIGVYVPLFAGYTPVEMLVVVIVFAVMIALWCFLGKKLSDLPGLKSFLLKYKQVIVPVVFIALGIYIIVSAW